MAEDGAKLSPGGHSSKSSFPDTAGSTYFLGRYRVVEEIGVGGMASVHLARMDGPGGFQKWIAIKRIHPHLVEDESFVTMFLDEARIAARISHPNVATVFELGKHADTYWIAMEYLHGEPLREVMRRTEELGQPTPPEIACRIIADAAEGLHAAHELLGKDGEMLGLVHRDVTPHNLFVTYDGNTKVVDFGIAKFSTRMASTRAGTLKGKLAYMSPEQVQGDPIDRRTDLFALGVVLWELTTGQRLFRMDSDIDTLARVQECNVPRPSRIVRGYPLELEKIVMKALAKDKNERFKTAREFSRALQSHLMRRGLFVASDEVAAYTQSIFEDRIGKREAHLRWAAEVTKTVNIDGLAKVSDSSNHESSQSAFASEVQPAPTYPVPRPAAGSPIYEYQGDGVDGAKATSQLNLAQTVKPGMLHARHTEPPIVSVNVSKGSRPDTFEKAFTLPSRVPSFLEIGSESGEDVDDVDDTLVTVGPLDFADAADASPLTKRLPSAHRSFPRSTPDGSESPFASGSPKPKPKPPAVHRTGPPPIPPPRKNTFPQAPAQAPLQPADLGRLFADLPEPPVHQGSPPLLDLLQPAQPSPQSASLGRMTPTWVLMLAAMLLGVVVVGVFATLLLPSIRGNGGATPPTHPVRAPGAFSAARSTFGAATAIPPPRVSSAPSPHDIAPSTAPSARTESLPMPLHSTRRATAFGNPPPPRTPASEADMGLLTIFCAPACDEVIDLGTGKNLGGTPLEKSLAVGEHRLKLVRKTPYLTKVRSVIVTSTTRTIVRESMQP